MMLGDPGTLDFTTDEAASKPVDQLSTHHRTTLQFLGHPLQDLPFVFCGKRQLLHCSEPGASADSQLL